jgi:twitching motility protein PilT
MSRIGPLLDALRRSDAEEMRLVPGERIFVLRRGQRQDVGREPLAPATTRALALELFPTGDLESLSPGEPRGMSVSHEGEPFDVRIEGREDGIVLALKRTVETVTRVEVVAPVVAAPRLEASVPTESLHPIDHWLSQMPALGASDLHLSPGCKPVMRVDGAVRFLDDDPALMSEQISHLLEPILTPRAREDFAAKNDADFAYEIPGLARFRVNVFRERNGVGAVFRQIPVEILTAERLQLPKPVLDFCGLSKGLVVVTGPTGSGKSTTLAAMVDYINKIREDHIITIEDPIEFVHTNQKCLVNQREVGPHTASFKQALRAALREDPDIVLVGEMRDLETVAIALETAETGHLVFGTLHTTTAVSTIDRIIDQFPSNQQAQIRVMLADSLRGVIAQVLCRRIGGGRVAALEVLIGNTPVGALIREGKTFQIPSVMQTSRGIGMITMNESLMTLVRDKVIEPREAYFKATDKSGLLGMMKSGGVRIDFL